MRYVLLLSLLLSGYMASSQCTLRFSGSVADADTREKLAGATIEIREARIKTITGKDGRFTIEGLCPGHYDIVITHTGCEPLSTHIHIKDDFTQEYRLPHSVTQLSGVTVVGTGNTPNATREEIKGKDLEAVRGLSLGESLKKITGVSVLQTGNNIYKPVIHGLHSNRVLILNNGIRQEGQQWGNEHAPEVDPYIANRISVIKGAATMRYGGDAIGGVILVEPKLLRAVPGWGGELNMAMFSNNRMGVLSGILEGNLKKQPAFSWRVQGTMKRGGNARTPRYWLANSGMEELNFSVTAGWRKTKWNTELFYSQFNTRLAIFTGSHIGNVTDLMNAINSKEPPDYIRSAGFSYALNRPYQDVQHHLIKSKTSINTGSIGRLNLVASWQYNNRKEYDVKRFQSSEDVPQLDLSIGTAALDIVWDHFTWKGFRGTMGVAGSFQDNQYSRRLFIPNFQALNTGLFLIEKYEYRKWMFEAGVRYDYRSFFNTTSNSGRIYPDRDYASTSANAGVSFRLHPAASLQLSLSTAWRAPNVNELYSDGLHHGAARLEKGDSSLSAERANNLMISLLINKERFTLEAGVYSKQIDGFIYLEPTYPPQLTIRGAFPSFRFAQTRARLNGADIHASYAFTHHLSWTNRLSLLRAWNKQADEWLIQMPADRFESEWEYTFNNGRVFRESYAKAAVQYVFKQTRTPATGQIEITRADGSKYLASDYAPPPPAYGLLSLEAGTQLKLGDKNITLIAGVSNLLNHAYRDYMNAFRYYADEMGRNISLRIKVPFEKGASNKKQ